MQEASEANKLSSAGAALLLASAEFTHFSASTVCTSPAVNSTAQPRLSKELPTS